MSQDYGVFITSPGADASQGSPGVSANKVTMNTTLPFIKIDTTNSVGFQTITLLITTDPPAPVGPATDTYTTLYKFKHGYSYIPSVETLFVVTTPPPTAAQYQAYSLDTVNLAETCTLEALVDATWVYFVAHKYTGFFGDVVLTGTNVSITCHVFVEDIGV
jgi:hypothetical protein